MQNGLKFMNTSFAYIINLISTNVQWTVSFAEVHVPLPVISNWKTPATLLMISGVIAAWMEANVASTPPAPPLLAPPDADDGLNLGSRPALSICLIIASGSVLSRKKSGRRVAARDEKHSIYLILSHRHHPGVVKQIWYKQVISIMMLALIWNKTCYWTVCNLCLLPQSPLP